MLAGVMKASAGMADTNLAMVTLTNDFPSRRFSGRAGEASTTGNSGSKREKKRNKKQEHDLSLSLSLSLSLFSLSSLKISI